MAYFSRLILALLLCVGFTMPVQASEIVPSGPLGCGADPEPNAFNPYATDRDFSPKRECRSGVNGPGTVTWGWLNQCTRYSWCPSWYPTNTIAASPTCPTDSTLNSSGQCECTTGYKAVDGKCDPPPPNCSENQELDPDTNTCVCKSGPAGDFAVSGDVYTGCNDGCTIVLSSGSYSKSTNKTYGTWNQNGNTCSPSPDSPGVDAPDSQDGQDAGKCPTGQCPGTVNGQFMCVPCKGKESSDSSSSENTTQTPNGASAPSSSSSESSSGSKSTECEGGVCVTKEKVVVVNPDGSTTEKEKETTESISDFCAKNPKAAICKAVEDGRWGGSCSGGFQCSGDAVQCAQAQAAWKSACAADVSGMSDQINTGSAAMAAGAASGLGIPGGSDVFDLGSRLSEVPLFGSSGGCPSDVSVNVGGTSYTIAFSAMCGQLQVLGVALMGFAYLIAGFIVFRGDRS